MNNAKKNMRIGIDGFSFQEKPSGIGKYFLSLVKLLIEHYPHYTYICYSNKSIVLPKEILEHVIIRRDESAARMLKPTIWLKLKGGAFIKNDSLDFYLSSAGLFPNLGKKVKRVALVHDLNYVVAPDTMGRLHRISNRFFLKKDVQHADFIIANSLGTSDKIHTYFGIRPNVVINPPTSPIFRKLDEIATQKILDKYAINYPYFLTVGTLEPRKNLLFTFTVFRELFDKNMNHGHKLVVVGGGGWKNGEILELCEANQSNIKRLGYVPEEDLPALYNGARAFLFPSVYEGFGMPVREAVHCGCTVITSNLVELKESSYGSAIFIDPHNRSEFFNVLETILNNNYSIPQPEYSKKNEDIDFFIEYFKKA
jgi:glycosyltransferase involved in cell wall biosynthesis